jgi:hypothetical protein
MGVGVGSPGAGYGLLCGASGVANTDEGSAALGVLSMLVVSAAVPADDTVSVVPADRGGGVHALSVRSTSMPISTYM